MKRFTLTPSVLLVIVILSSCDSARKTFGLKKAGPDEFLVYQRPPLSQPPDYGLRPPAQGLQPKQVSSVKLAKNAVLGENRTNQGKENQKLTSPGIAAFLRTTGAKNADPSIRQIIEKETTIFSQEDKRFVDRLIFWSDEKPYEGSIINPKEEQKRIKSAEALGKPVTDGKTVHVKRKRRKKGLLSF